MEVTVESGREPLRDHASYELLQVLIRSLRLRVSVLRALLVADAVLTPLSLIAAFEFNFQELLASQAEKFNLASSYLDWILVVWLRDLLMGFFVWRSRRGDATPEEACRHTRAARWVAMAIFLYGVGRLSELQWRSRAPAKLVPTFVLSSVMAPVLAMAAHFLLKAQERIEERIGASSEATETDDAAQYSSELTFCQTLSVMKPYFWPSNGPPREVALNRARALSTWVCVAGSRAANLFSPLFLARATNAFASQLESGRGGPVSPEVVRNLVYYAFVIFLSKALKELQSLVYIKVQQAAYIEIAENTFVHLHSLSLDWHLRKKMGNVISSIDRGIQAAQQVMQYVFLYLFPTLAESVAVGLIFVLRFKNVRLAIFMFLNLYLYCYVTVKVTLWRKRFRTATTQHDNDLHDRLTDSLVNYETIKYFTAEDYEHREYRNVVQKFQQMSMATQASLSLLNTVQQMIITFTLAGGMIIACVHLLQDGGSLGEFVAVNTYIVQTFAPLNFLATIYNMAINAIVDMKNFGQLLAETSEIVDEPNAKLLDTTQKTCPMIEFRSVSFHYRRQPTERSLKNISFATPRGGTTALVGTTGAGKTTITRLLFRFYDPICGQVLVNGQDVRSVTQKSLRQSMGFVPQDVVLFNATISHNIKYGKIDDNCSKQCMEDAAEKAQLSDFVEQQADGYETMCGERGLKLSGGEKQRLAIARCLVKNPPIVVLDEATSALDSQTEQRIQQALDVLSTSRTVVAIAHRLSTVRNFDDILVLEAGEIVERGSHEQLLVAGERYADMWRCQAASSDTEPSSDADTWRRQAASSTSTSAPATPTSSLTAANAAQAESDMQKCPISGKEGEGCPMAFMVPSHSASTGARGRGRGRGQASPR